MRRLPAIVLVAVAALAVPAGAQERPLLRSVDGPTPMRALATGFGSTVFSWHYGRDASPVSGDGERWVAWRLPDKPGSTLLDTQTMTVRDVPECRLANGHRGTFVAACGPEGQAKGAALHDAATGETRPLPGAKPGDDFTRMGSQWVAGNDAGTCDDPKCEVGYVWVNWHTGRRHVAAPCGDCELADPGDFYDLDAPNLRRPRHDPLTVQGDVSITRRFRHALVVRQRGRRPVRLSDCRGPERFDRCDDSLAARRVSWATTDLRPAGPSGTIRTYDVDTAARALDVPLPAAPAVRLPPAVRRAAALLPHALRGARARGRSLRAEPERRSELPGVPRVLHALRGAAERRRAVRRATKRRG